MSKIKNIFLDSLREFANLRSIVTAALLVALHTVMAMYLSIMVTDTLRISLSFLANIAIGALFGPVMGFVCGGVGDIVQFFLKPQGYYFFGWTLNAALAGFIYGLFFYKRFPRKMAAASATGKDKREAKERVKKTQEEYKERKLTISVVLQVLLCVAIVVLWFAAPFGQVIGKESKEVLVSGSGFVVLKGVIGGHGGAGLGIVAAILLAAAVIMLFVIITRHFAVGLAVSVVAAFISLLAVYTDKTVTRIGAGFVAIVAGYVVLIVLALWELSRKNQMDFKAILRIVFTLTLDTLLVNVLLGTYWCSVMYGKGFVFYFTSRFIKNMVQLPINVLLTYYVLGFLRDIRNRVDFHQK